MTKKTDELIFPMTLDYASEWSDWDVVRELTANAMDVDPNFTIEMKSDPAALVIKSRGSSLNVEHLLFGNSQKLGKETVGQFGEGLKLALLVLTRMGLNAEIYSGGKKYWNAPAEMAGKDVFKVCWRNGFKTDDQTVVAVRNWQYPAYEERFIRPGDPRIVHTDAFGRSILEEEVPNIYVRGVWVQKAKAYSQMYAFSYNLIDAKMNRDRCVVDIWKSNREIARIWAGIQDVDLLQRFWQAVHDQNGERDCQFHGIDIKGRKEMEQAFRSVYGEEAVVSTGEGASREAKYRGGKPVELGSLGNASLSNLAKMLVGTDTELVTAMSGGVRSHVPESRLANVEKKSLRVVRRLARRIGILEPIDAYALDEGIKGERQGDRIRLSLDVLQDPVTAVETWLHEEGHRQADARDVTPEHAEAIAHLAAQVIVGYATR